MDVAILGATGQVGSDLLDRVRSHGRMTPVVVGRDRVDLDDIDGIRPALGDLDFDILVNCAAFTAVDDAESSADRAFRLNARAPEQLALACRDADARLIHLSTDYVFDGETDRPYSPWDAPGPLSVYGSSKLMGEALIRRSWRGGAVIVRTSSVFGLAGMAEGKGNFVETILRQCRERDRIAVVADTTMSPTYSEDLARALVALIEVGAGPGIYHVTNQGETSWYAFARAIVQGRQETLRIDPVPAVDYPRPARRPRYSVLDTSQTDELIAPLPDWRQALGRYLEEREDRGPPDR